MTTRVVTAPAQEPVDVAYVKAQNHQMNWSDDDSYLGDLIADVRTHAEEQLWRAFVTQTLEAVIDLPGCDMRTGWPVSERLALAGYRIELPRPPLQSVSSVELEVPGNVWVSATGYVVDTSTDPGALVFPNGLPTLPALRAKVRYVAGYGDDPADVPSPIRRAIAQRVAALYAAREGEKFDSGGSDLLLAPYRVRNIA